MKQIETNSGAGGAVPNNPREIYDSTGDSLSALRALENSKNGTATATGTGGSTHSASSYAPFEHYNRVLLAGLSKQKLGIPKDDDETFIHRLGIAHAAVLDAHESQIKAGIKASPFDVQREIWQLTYNQTLMFIAHGNYDLAKASVVNELGPLLDALTNAKAAGERGKQALEDMELPPESAKLGCRLGFALLESTLSKYPFQLTNNDGTQVDVKYLKSLTDFLQENVERKDVGGDDPQLKFLWSLYKSRLDFFQRDHDGKLVDSSIRSARKELKTAMEIFQHKLLRGAASNESASLASSSSAGAGTSGGVSSVSGTGGGGGGGGGDTLTPSVQQQYVQPTMPRDLQAANRAALNLKANTELLKGNVKKSLVLCGEALSSVSYDESYDDQTKTYYDAIHQNNLALIYAASGKYYLASHALSKAITAAEASGSLVDRFERADGGRISAERRVSTAPCNFDTDGTVRADLTVQILNNAAICSLRTGNYLAAYECMSKCIENSEIWQNRTRSWIHLAEACIGMYLQRKQEEKVNSVPPFTAAASSSIATNGKPRGLLVTTTTGASDYDQPWGDYETGDLPTLGTDVDKDFIQKFPLIRAKNCLEIALKQFDRIRMAPRDIVAQQSTRCSLAYVCMELKEYAVAQRYCEKLILAGYDLVDSSSPSSGDDDGKQEDGTEKMDDAQLILIKRLMATARLYAAEASSILGDSLSSMTFILGDKKDNALDRLAMDLSGVTIEKANSSPKAKTQLAKAQCIVRCNASAGWAVLGNHPASRQLAMSAQAMENSYATNRDGSAARKALMYGMLREGNQGSALLTLLRSSTSSSIR